MFTRCAAGESSDGKANPTCVPVKAPDLFAHRAFDEQVTAMRTMDVEPRAAGTAENDATLRNPKAQECRDDFALRRRRCGHRRSSNRASAAGRRRLVAFPNVRVSKICLRPYNVRCTPANGWWPRSRTWSPHRVVIRRRRRDRGSRRLRVVLRGDAHRRIQRADEIPQQRRRLYRIDRIEMMSSKVQMAAERTYGSARNRDRAPGRTKRNHMPMKGEADLHPCR